MKQYKRLPFVAVVISASILLTGCDIFSISYRTVERKALKEAGKYAAEKYGEDFNGDEVRTYSQAGTGTPFPPSNGKAKVTDIQKGYSIFVDFSSNRKVGSIPQKIGDNKQLPEIKESFIKEYFSQLPEDLKYSIAHLDIFNCMLYVHGGEVEDETAYFTQEAYYDGDLEEFLDENENNIHLELDFELEKKTTSQDIERYKTQIESALIKILDNFKGNDSYIIAKIYNHSSDEIYSLFVSDKTKDDADLKWYVESLD